jgi:toxin ParE1/3/4
MAWQTTALADEDIADIEAFGTLAFGRRQAERYVDELFELFDLIAANPRIGPQTDEVSGGLRLCTLHSHRVFYELNGCEVLILRVLHASSDWPSHLRKTFRKTPSSS